MQNDRTQAKTQNQGQSAAPISVQIGGGGSSKSKISKVDDISPSSFEVPLIDSDSYQLGTSKVRSSSDSTSQGKDSDRFPSYSPLQKDIQPKSESKSSATFKRYKKDSKGDSTEKTPGYTAIKLEDDNSIPLKINIGTTKIASKIAHEKLKDDRLDDIKKDEEPKFLDNFESLTGAKEMKELNIPEDVDENEISSKKEERRESKHSKKDRGTSAKGKEPSKSSSSSSSSKETKSLRGNEVPLAIIIGNQGSKHGSHTGRDEDETKILSYPVLKYLEKEDDNDFPNLDNVPS